MTQHTLLPPERWFASLILERQRSHRTTAVLRIETNYGPEGITLWAAGMVTVLPGQLIAFMGILILLLLGWARPVDHRQLLVNWPRRHTHLDRFNSICSGCACWTRIPRRAAIPQAFDAVASSGDARPAGGPVFQAHCSCSARAAHSP